MHNQYESSIVDTCSCRESAMQQRICPNERHGSLTMDDLLATHAKWIKDRTYVYAILGDPADLDLGFLKTLGPVQQVTLEEIFGY